MVARAASPGAGTAARWQRTAGATTGIVVAGAAAAGLLLWWLSPAAGYLDHGSTAAPHVEHPGALALLAIFTVAWLLMTAATMLPTAIPLLTAFDRLVAARHDRERLNVIVVAGFLGVWMLSGVLLSVLDLGIHGAVESGALGVQPSHVLAGTLVLGGAYQLSPVANRCLLACRSPFGLLARHWSGAADPRRQAWRIGRDHGYSCLGCCAPLMALMFAVGMANPAWMLLFAAVAAAQKALPWGRGLATATGLVMVAVGALLAAQHLWTAE